MVHERSIVLLADVLTNVVIMIIYSSGHVHRFVVTNTVVAFR